MKNPRVSRRKEILKLRAEINAKETKEIIAKINNPNPVGHGKSSPKGKVHSNTGIPQETRKSQINNLTLHLKQLEKGEMKNPRVSRGKEIFKFRTEINAKETKETIAKINKSKSSSLKG